MSGTEVEYDVQHRAAAARGISSSVGGWAWKRGEEVAAIWGAEESRREREEEEGRAVEREGRESFQPTGSPPEIKMDAKAEARARMAARIRQQVQQAPFLPICFDRVLLGS